MQGASHPAAHLLRELIPDDASIQYTDHFVGIGQGDLRSGQEARAGRHRLQTGERGLSVRPVALLAEDQELQGGRTAILGVVQEAGKPTMALLGDKEDRHFIGSAAVVLTKLDRDLFWRAVELLADRKPG